MHVARTIYRMKHGAPQMDPKIATHTLCEPLAHTSPEPFYADIYRESDVPRPIDTSEEPFLSVDRTHCLGNIAITAMEHENT